jgi:peptidoglycan/xylan/chitin deacetylase (PgdA/CDA1 family)
MVVAVVACLLLEGCGGHKRPRAQATPTPSPTAAAKAHHRQRFALPAAPAQVRGAAARRMAVPILMYHVIATPGPGAVDVADWLTERDFAAQMRALRRAGYHAITLRAAFAAWRRGAPLPRRPVVLSFDDGYLGDYTRARPILRRMGWPAVLNLVLKNVRRGDLTPHQIRALIASGWEVDSHTLTHRDLTTLDDATLRHELVGSRREIRRRFGQPADFFTYPSGSYDARVVAAVRAAGYRGALTTHPGYGMAGEPFELKRVRVSYGEGASALLAALRAQRPR